MVDTYLYILKGYLLVHSKENNVKIASSLYLHSSVWSIVFFISELDIESTNSYPVKLDVYSIRNFQFIYVIGIFSFVKQFFVSIIKFLYSLYEKFTEIWFVSVTIKKNFWNNLN